MVRSLIVFILQILSVQNFTAICKLVNLKRATLHGSFLQFYWLASKNGRKVKLFAAVNTSRVNVGFRE